MEVYLNKTIEEMAKLGYTPVVAPSIISLPTSTVARLTQEDHPEGELEKMLSEIGELLDKTRGEESSMSSLVKATVLTLNTEQYDAAGKLVGQRRVCDSGTNVIHIPMLSYMHTILVGGHRLK